MTTPDTPDDAFAKWFRGAFHVAISLIGGFTIIAAVGFWITWIKECCQ